MNVGSCVSRSSFTRLPAALEREWLVTNGLGGFAGGTIAPRGFELLENFRLDHRTLLYDPFILRYKDDPRFAAFCRQVGLPVSGEVPPRNST
jgi:hypothetical protein